MSVVDLWYIEKSDVELFDTKLIYTKILSKYVNHKDITITYNKYGKPVLPSKNNLFFSASHTLNMMVVVVTRDNEVGVDIEKATRNIYKPLLLAEKFFHIRELKLLHESRHLESDFIRLWVIKESFVKMMGQGISYGLDRCYADVTNGAIFDVKANKYCEYSLFSFFNNFICCITPRFDNINFCNFRQL